MLELQAAAQENAKTTPWRSSPFAIARYAYPTPRVTLMQSRTRNPGQLRLAIQQGAPSPSAVQVMVYCLLCCCIADSSSCAGRIEGALTRLNTNTRLRRRLGCGLPWVNNACPGRECRRPLLASSEQLPARYGWRAVRPSATLP